MLIERDKVHELLATIPERPGCYIYRDKSDVVIYVGKAKNLRKRIASYFQRDADRPNARAMLRVFRTIEYMVVQTEHDALLLENNLIKQYQPNYNIMLKQGNNYPFICVKNEPFPRVFVTFKVVRDGSVYYGPYPNRSMAWMLINLFRKIYKFRTCSLDLSPDVISRRHYRVCLKYHIQRCDAPCEGLQTKGEYDSNIAKARLILEGNIRGVKQIIVDEMEQSSAALDFETANELYHTLQSLEQYQAKSTIISGVIGDALVTSCASDEDAFYLNYLLIHDGNIIAGRTLEYKKKLDEEESEIFATAIVDLLSGLSRGVGELIIPYCPEFADFAGMTVTVPQRGDRKKVLNLSLDNVHQYMQDKYKQAEKLNPEQRNMKVLKELQSAVGLPVLPFHVECFDNSNISGTDPVAACVVFKGGKPSKKDYRLFHIRGGDDPDDYASMYEVVVRRYNRLRDEGAELPDLIITDGGRGHMSTVKSALREVGVDIPVLGLAKDDKHNTNEVLYGDPPIVVGIMQRGQVFYLLERIQNEVHRFAIEFHRKLRSKRQVHSELDDITGVGAVTKKRLLQSFKSVKRMREASLEDLQSAVGKSKGRVLYDYFRTKEKEVK